jgi:hypothetical protein
MSLITKTQMQAGSQISENRIARLAEAFGARGGECASRIKKFITRRLEQTNQQEPARLTGLPEVFAEHNKKK